MTTPHAHRDKGAAAAPVTLTWPGDRLLADDLRAALCGPGAPFERTIEDVLGTPLEVFVQRAGNVRELLVHARRTTPDLPYLVFDGPEKETYTYAQAHDLAAAYAEVLATGHGVAKGDRVAVAAPNTREHVMTYWAAVSLGAIVVGLNGWWTPPEMAHGVELTEPALVLGSGRPLERVSEAAWIASSGVPVVHLADLHRAALALQTPPAELPAVRIDEDDPAAIMFTSGTTGRPKGATISHRNFVYFAMNGMLNGALNTVRDAGRYREPGQGVQRASLCVSPLFHVSGIGITLAAGPASGLKVVFPGPGRWDAERVLGLTDEYLITQWSGVPTHYWRLLSHPEFDGYRTGQVTMAGSGGAVFAPELMRFITERMPGVQLGNGYGMTETLGTGTLTSGSLLEAHPDSVGWAIPCTRVQVRGLDDEPLPEGEIGEIHIQGPGVFLGYWRDPEATGKALASNRWYRTGDYGRIEDGRLYLESRMRDLILRGGENIYPIEIEFRLVAHPLIAEACVIGVPDKVLGQEVKAFVVLEDGAALTVEEARAWVGAALAAFKVPAYVEFRDALPYNETGKVMKRLLEEEQQK
ncbi:class I adenylate-forming enzyme family protein [Actinocorallia sp. A-T 12471]|uniref:class I adenylate-forming enzyme family protein n=1 Tax=Actinocorallia sp. A-T 12471 TaxID=3089813 RepID=UPI0029CF7E1D|nr:class I adenylate-forming enzyme family protein [Actinocorallia sp. A-T 12471]MDX6740739.1 class I adenylate-forming enzyme family protein [Actinocorallia sp. A-T 12471]